MRKVFLHIIIPLFIIALGVLGFRALMSQAREAEHAPPARLALPVEVVAVTPRNVKPKITASGLVTAARQVTLTPEVGGRVIKLSPRLIPGTRFRKGELVARIDQRDYKLALAQEEARVRQAELELEIERSRGRVAEKEWALLGADLKKSGVAPGLVLRKSQLDAAKRQTASSKSGLERAQLNLKRTVLRAPFNAIVVDKRVDVGQLVGPSTPVATLMGSDELWVDVSVPLDELDAIDVPGVNAKVGSKATVIQRLGSGREVKREGEVLRLQGQLDAQNRTAKLLVSVRDPFETGGNDLPLLAGAYVNVEIEGRELEEVFEIPRQALIDDDYVWVASENDKLRKAEVEVGWRTRDTVMIQKGLKVGDRVITSPLPFAIEGTDVKPVQDRESASTEAAAPRRGLP